MISTTQGQQVIQTANGQQIIVQNMSQQPNQVQIQNGSEIPQIQVYIDFIYYTHDFQIRHGMSVSVNGGSSLG